MDGSGNLDGAERSEERRPSLDPSTTYCAVPSCSTLRRIVKVLESHRFAVQERVEVQTASGAWWEETDRVAYERKVRLDCEHGKGLIGT